MSAGASSQDSARKSWTTRSSSRARRSTTSAGRCRARATLLRIRGWEEGGQAAHGAGILVQCHDPVERVVVPARVEVDGDARPLLLGDVSACGHHEADVLVRVLGKKSDQVRVQVRVARERAALGRLSVVSQVFGEAAFEAAGLNRALSDSFGIEHRTGHRVLSVVPQQRLDAHFAGRIAQKLAPGRAVQMRPGPLAG
ncbi:hypothetical protein [Streptomyces sp. KMM 9044]|uniref:hypothetical protein n=1 Tax=Streptomyces sp. KMM 9044 TaxID=2744474 RepID=UPI0022B230E4|nr:hypothetical protein [Streptomyces sp. KMM 9044]WAX76856.1 hypothetical protein HUV60_003430 [Streptomyces sp. KMM 9044]